MEFITVCVIILCVMNIFLFYLQWELKYFVYTTMLQALQEIKQLASELQQHKQGNVTVNVNNTDNNTSTNGNDNTTAQNANITDTTIG